jgi:hypothetical protein
MAKYWREAKQTVMVRFKQQAHQPEQLRLLPIIPGATYPELSHHVQIWWPQEEPIDQVMTCTLDTRDKDERLSIVSA